ncbi:hypothetical protein F5Y09DRAFT_216922 [Xylaria sp. FL1042]|nr:hypothetical protein F5Y09DRAFT_216922 [Xylaria sp. FL1042]
MLRGRARRSTAQNIVTNMNLRPPHVRMGARGVRKVRSGCQTCKIRHKKCDESRPSCFQCSSSGRQCEFILPTQPSHRDSSGWKGEQAPRYSLSLTRPMLGPSQRPTSNSNVESRLESVRFEFFRLVCAPEYGVLFETVSWETLVLQYATTELCIYHAALAVSVLTWNHYSPMRNWYDTETGARSVAEYATIQYNLAIRRLNARLSSSMPDRDVTKLVIMSAILFINIEFLRQEQAPSFRESFVSMHLRGATCLLHDLKSRSGLQPDSVRQCLEIGISHIGRQARQLEENMIYYNTK